MNRILKILKENWIRYGFETMVVTVGILGAFSLESWKDKRQHEKELLEIYQTVSNDLQSDIQALDSILIGFEWQIALMKRIVTVPISMDEWANNDSLAMSFLGYADFQESQRGLDLLKSKIAITGETGILASRISNFYKKNTLEINVTKENLITFLDDNLKYWMANCEWLSLALIERDLTLLGQYAKDNPYFRNRISAYMTILRIYHGKLDSYKDDGAILADEINTFLEDN